MNLVSLSARNVLRNRFRTILTVVGVAVAILAFVLLRTVSDAWTAAADYAAKDRIGIRNKITFIVPLPLRYYQEVLQTKGVTAATYANWFGAKDPKHDKEFFATLAVDAKSVFEVYDEISVDPADKERFLQDRQGAIVGDVLAKKLGWKVGDKVTLQGTIYPGDWVFNISGIYTATRKSVDRSTFWFHWDYMNEGLPDVRRDKIGWIIARIDDPTRAADISKEIDKHFDDQEVQTLSMSERAMQVSFMAMLSAIFDAIDIISLVILAIMMLILGNTIAMGVRERTHEYGTMRAIGFLPRHVSIFILGEAITTGVLGGALGLAISYPLVNQGIGRFLEENMGGMFPYFKISPVTAAMSFAIAIALGVIAALIPAYRASKLNVVDALRRVG